MINTEHVTFYMLNIEQHAYCHFHFGGRDYIIQGNTTADIDKKRSDICAGRGLALLELENPDSLEDAVSILGYMPEAMQYVSNGIIKGSVAAISSAAKYMTGDKILLLMYYMGESHSVVMKRINEMLRHNKCRKSKPATAKSNKVTQPMSNQLVHVTQMTTTESSAIKKSYRWNIMKLIFGDK